MHQSMCIPRGDHGHRWGVMTIKIKFCQNFYHLPSVSLSEIPTTNVQILTGGNISLPF